MRFRDAVDPLHEGLERAAPSDRSPDPLSPLSDEADPPAYTLSTASLSSTASLEDGRLLLDLRLAKGLPDLPKWWANDAVEEHLETAPASSEGWKGKVPKLKVLILIVGSRGAFSLLGLSCVFHLWRRGGG